MNTLQRLFLFFVLLTLLAQGKSVAQSRPTELEGTFSSTDQTIELRWHVPEVPTGPSFYNVYRKVNGDSVFHFLNTANDRRYDDGQIILSTVYYYYVTAVYDGGGESVPSNTVIVGATSDSMAGGSILPPKNLTGLFDDRGVVELGWLIPDSSSPSFYRVYRNVPAIDSSFNLLGLAPETEFDDSTIVDSTMYRYYVTAVYPGNVESVPSNILDIFVASREDSSDDSGNGIIIFTSNPSTLGFPGQVYQYTPVVTVTPANTPVCFTLKRGPEGMTIDPSTGTIQWTPISLGIFRVALKARACSGPEAEGEQEFRIMVASGVPGQLSGRVQDELSHPLANVRIKIFDVSHGAFVLKVRTDSLGEYRFHQVSPGSYFVRADADNELYEDQWFDNVKRMQDATPVIVQETTQTVVNFTLHNEDHVATISAITGFVNDTSGNPIAGAMVSVFRVSDRQADDDFLADDHGDDHGDGLHHGHGDDDAAIALTDSTGHYSLSTRHGRYLVSVRAQGFDVQFWDGKSSPLEADVLILNQDTSGINFNLKNHASHETGQGSISGRVFNLADSGGIVAHVIGFQKDPMGHFTGFKSVSRSDSTGNYRLESLPQGYYIVLARAKDDFIPTFYSLSGGTPFIDSSTTLFVNQSEVPNINIYVPEDSAEGLNDVSGEIESEHGQGVARVPNAVNPLSGAIIVIQDNLHRVVGSGISHSDGTYQVPGLSPGTYMLIFQKPGKLTSTATSTVTYVNNAPTTTMVNGMLIEAPPASGSGLMNVQRNWNLVSIPVSVADARKQALFPLATSNAFSYNGSYQIASTLEYGSGYWVKFGGPTVLSVDGIPVTSHQVSLNAGWNLIGSLSYPVAVSTITTSPAGIFASQVFGYSGGYSVTNVLEPGKGYWIKTSQAGTFMMEASQGAAIAKFDAPISVSTIAGVSSITISDAAGNTQELYVTQANGIINPATYELPPTPPSGGFDSRFGSQRSLEVYPSGLKVSREYSIIIQPAKDPLNIQWSIRDSRARFSIIDRQSGSVPLTRLGSTGSLKLNASSEPLHLMLLVEPAELPVTFALNQNYPNPFNPSTTLSFELPMNARVTLKVFNVVGQEVATLLENVQRDAGAHSVQFDAHSLSSGVYFYRMEASGIADPSTLFKEVRKMVLMK